MKIILLRTVCALSQLGPVGWVGGGGGGGECLGVPFGRVKVFFVSICVVNYGFCFEGCTVSSLLTDTSQKTDTYFLRDTLCWSQPFFSHFTVIKLLIRWTL